MLIPTISGGSLRGPLEGKPSLRIHLQVIIWAIAFVWPSLCGFSQVPISSHSLQPMAPGYAKAPATAAKAALLFCPAAGSPMLLQSAPGVGHHTVALSWNASTPSPRPQDNAVGYCLYRSEKKGAAKQNANCRDCEQVNRVPIAAIRCVDDVVKGGATYYYVVTAINAKGKLSLPSNEVVAAVPTGKQNLNSASTGSFSVCRGPTSLK
jgi:hypothetical protein